MKWIRWQGVVAFVVVVALITVVWFGLVDGWVKRTIEASGTALVGAKVELDAADLSLSPMGLTLTGLQVTNPDEPMTNAVEIARIAGTLDPLPLFRRKIIIDEMTVDGLRLNTPRTYSGAIAQRPEKGREADEANHAFNLPSVQLNDPKEILARELDQLESLKLAEQVQADVQAEKARWRQRIAELPGEAKFNDYKARIENLRSAGKAGLGGVLSGVEELTQIQDELRQDLARIHSVKDDLQKAIGSFKQRVQAVAAVPRRDVNRLVEKYSVSSQGLANVTRLLFTGTLADYVQTAVQWHKRLEPFLSRPTETKVSAQVEVVKPLRAKGVDVHFPERAPLPEWLVRKARVSVETSAGTISGDVKNLTAEQHVLGAPLIFAFAGDELKDFQAITLKGTINRVDRMTPQDDATLHIEGYRLNRLTLGGTNTSVVLSRGTVDLNARAALTGPLLDATIRSKMREVHLETVKEVPAGPVGKAIAGALADVNAFEVNAMVSGTQDQYDMKVDSDLDDVLAHAVGKQAKAQAAKLEGQLRSAIDDKVNAKLAEARGHLRGFDELTRELTGRADIGQEVLDVAAASVLGGKSGAFKLPF